jgi:hypothetical protein
MAGISGSFFSISKKTESVSRSSSLGVLINRIIDNSLKTDDEGARLSSRR